jgi:transposase
MFKLLLLMFLYQVKFERELERRANDSLAWRWFCGYELDEPVVRGKTLWHFATGWVVNYSTRYLPD